MVEDEKFTRRNALKECGFCGIILTMKRKMLFLIIPALILAAIHIGCARKDSADDRVLAKVSNRTITLRDFKSRAAKMPSYYQNIIEKNKKGYLDEVILEMLLYEEAVRNGVDKDKEVKDVLDAARKKIIVAKFIKNEVEDRVKVTDAEMKQFYEYRKDDFKSPEMWRASHILVSTEKEAAEIQDALSKGANFEELAKAHSIDATASRGGDVGYFRAGQLVPDFEKVCLKLNIGQVSDIVHTQFGYHIIKLTDKKEPGVKVYAEAKRAIEAEMKKQKRGELFNALVLSLKNKYGVEVNEDAFPNEAAKEKKPPS